MTTSADIQPQQLLTEERCAWVLAIKKRTLRDLRRRRAIPFFKVGNLVRYEPAAVLAFIRQHTRAPRRPAGAAGPGAVTDMDAAAWERIERLIAEQVRAISEAMGNGKWEMGNGQMNHNQQRKSNDECEDD